MPLRVPLFEMLISHATLVQTRNLLRIAMFNIVYIRGLFPDNYFHDKYVPALGKSTVTPTTLNSARIWYLLLPYPRLPDLNFCEKLCEGV